MESLAITSPRRFVRNTFISFVTTQRHSINHSRRNLWRRGDSRGISAGIGWRCYVTCSQFLKKRLHAGIFASLHVHYLFKSLLLGLNILIKAEYITAITCLINSCAARSENLFVIYHQMQKEEPQEH